MKRTGAYLRITVALITLVVTTGRLIAPPAFATPAAMPVFEQLHSVDGGSEIGPKRLPRWPGGGRTMRVR